MAKRGNGEGTIYKRSNGKWCAAITSGINPKTGKPKREFFYGKTRQEVAEKLNKALNNLNQGTYVKPSSTALGDWLDTWLEQYKKSSIRPATYEIYDYLIKSHIKPQIGHIALKDLRTDHLQQLYNEKFKSGRTDGSGGLSAGSIKRMHNLLHGSLRQAMQNDLVIRNVSEATTLPKQEKKQIRILSVDEHSEFMKALSEERLKALFMLELGTGARQGELLAIRWQDINLDEGIMQIKRSLRRVKVDGLGSTKTKLIFQVPKTEAGKRIIPLPDQIVAELREHSDRQTIEKQIAGELYEDNELAFCTELGMPIDPRNLRKIFYRVSKKAGVSGVTFHALRHSYATRLLEANEHPKVVQEILGHSDITMTLNTYSHVMPEIKKAAAEKINFLFEPIKPGK